MAKEKRSQSSIGTFGTVVIAGGLFAGFITQSIYIAASIVAAGIFILLISAIVDRLDVIANRLADISKKLDEKAHKEET